MLEDEEESTKPMPDKTKKLALFAKKPPKEKGIIDEYQIEARPPSHNTGDVLVAGAISGAVAGFITNGMETLAVKKQTRPNFKVLKFLRKRGALRKVLFKGAGYRTFYYGVQACLLFVILEKLKEGLNCDAMDD